LYEFVNNSPIYFIDVNGHGPLAPGTIPFTSPPVNGLPSAEVPENPLGPAADLLEEANNNNNRNFLNEAVRQCGARSSTSNCRCCFFLLFIQNKEWEK
jgi:hypothetical protein